MFSLIQQVRLPSHFALFIVITGLVFPEMCDSRLKLSLNSIVWQERTLYCTLFITLYCTLCCTLYFTLYCTLYCKLYLTLYCTLYITLYCTL